MQTATASQISTGIVIRGEISGSSDLLVDGQVDGIIHLADHTLTVGPSGHVKANVEARNIIVAGRVEGNLTASDRLELRKSAVVMGDVSGTRLTIEEGAFLKGGIQVTRNTGEAPGTPNLFAAPGA